MNAESQESKRIDESSAARREEDFEFTGAWALKQFIKVILLGVLILVAMREADLDARAVEELRSRRTLLSAIERSSGSASTHQGQADLVHLEALYLTVCGECASTSTCEETLREMQKGKEGPTGKGPCKEGFLGPWGSRDVAQEKR